MKRSGLSGQNMAKWEQGGPNKNKFDQSGHMDQIGPNKTKLDQIGSQQTEVDIMERIESIWTEQEQIGLNKTKLD